MTSIELAQDTSATLRDCNNCPFGGPRVGIYNFGLTNRVTIVGEAPGRQELIEGRPFVGPSGQYLEKLLKEINLSLYDDCVILNTMQCAAPTGTTQSNLAQGIETCREHLLQDLLDIEPDIVLALGASAARAILGYSVTMKEINGQLRDIEIEDDFGVVHSIKVLFTYHPAAVLRGNAAARMKLETAISTLGKFLRDDLVEKSNNGREFRIIDTTEKLENLVKVLKQEERIACDIETTGLNPRQDDLISLGFSIKIGGDHYETFIIPGQIAEFNTEILNDLFSMMEIDFIWHNGKFDIQFLRNFGINAVCNQDTMLMHYAIFPDAKGMHGLKDIAVTLLMDVDNWAVDIRMYGNNFRDIPLDILYPYQANDCINTYRIYEQLKEFLDRDPRIVWLYENILVPLVDIYASIEMTGIPINVEYVRVLKHTLEEEKAAATKKMRAEIHARLLEINDEASIDVWDKLRKEKTVTFTAEKYNPSSPKQTQYVLYSLLGIKAASKDAASRIVTYNTAADTVALLAPHPFTEALTDYRKADKLLTSYIMPFLNLVESDGCIHSSFLIHGTETGRPSSTEPNMLTVPRDPIIKSMVQAPDGFKIMEFDFSQMEMRAFAAVSYDDYLTQCYIEDRDLHDETAEMLFGPEFTKEQRVKAKAVNFGIIYGIGPQKLVRMYNFKSYDEGYKTIQSWMARSVNGARYINWCRNHAETGKTLWTKFGRHRDFYGELYHTMNEASNFPIQSMANDITFLCAIEAFPHLEEYGAKLVNIIYDSMLFVIEDDPEKIAQFSEYMLDLMSTYPQELLNTNVPFKAEMGIGQTWGHMK